MKDFDGWNDLKKKIDLDNDISATFKEREIWWCSIGLNIGFEADGKNKLYNRPVLVISKFSNRLFWGLPLTTKIKDNPYYHHFIFNHKPQSAMLTHLRLYDSKRMANKIGQLPVGQFKKIVSALSNILNKK